MASVAVTPASGSITHLVTAVRVTCADVANNDASSYVAPTTGAGYPAEPQISYYFKFALSGQDSLISPIFSTNSAGIAEWDSVILPAAGSWTLTANKAADDTVAATATVVVA